MVSRIPPELRAALSQGASFSLLIKGAPGTGKTMLAFEILNEFGGENAIYLSTRVSIPALYHQFPWMEERADSLTVIDATKLYIPPTAVEEIRYYIPDEAYVKYKARLRAAKGFSGPYSLFNVIYKKVVDAEEPATLVVDSWEAITAVEKEMMMGLEAAITDLIETYSPKYRLNLILIAETTDITPLDYLVDGILELNRITIDYRRAREVVFKKLRSTRIDQHKYGFTLNDGRFRSFCPFERRKIDKPRKVDIVPNTATHVSTGCLEIDRILGGGISKGSTVMVEYADDLSLLGYQSIVAHMVVNSIQQGIHCVMIPSSGWDERRLRRGIIPFVKEEDYLKYFTVFEIRREERETRENVKVLPGVILSKEFPVFMDYISSLEPPVMAIIGTDWLEYQYRLKGLGNFEEALEIFAYWIMELRGAGNVGVFATPAEGVLGEGLGHMVTNRFELSVLDRSVVFYCNRPDTNLYCLENVITEDALKLQLTPFV